MPGCKLKNVRGYSAWVCTGLQNNGDIDKLRWLALYIEPSETNASGTNDVTSTEEK